MASRNGLNPKIRGPKGAGFGRALPAAFGFGNGIQPNVRDAEGNVLPYGYLTFPTLINQPVPTMWSIEFWIDLQSYPTNFEGVLEFVDNLNYNSSNTESRLQAEPSGNAFFQLLFNSGGFATGLSVSAVTVGQKNHFVFTIDTSKIGGISTATVNGVLSTKQTGSVTLYNYPYIGLFELLNLFAFNKYGLVTTLKFDEFRMYNKILSDIEIQTNYNNGIGNNPSITESLFTWFKFEKFENLDFSQLQDGSNIKLGMRDYSGKNNHGQSIGLITDPTNKSYCLTPF